MRGVRLICVGRLRERHYIAAFDEYKKRLAAFCELELTELPESRLPERPSERELASALAAEADAIERAIPKGAALVALCVEGDELTSEGLAAFLAGAPARLCFVIGGSNGMHERIKKRAVLRLSMSRMTFPHHLARVMLAEQLYRAFSITNGGKYHK